MSGAGISPLAIYDPDLYAKQIAIQRRQALAQQLIQQGENNGGSAPYGGLASAGRSILGAFLAKRADKQLGDLYAPPSQTAAPSTGQISNAPQTAGAAPAQAPPMASGGMPPANNSAQQPQAQPVQQPTGSDLSKPPDYATLPPQARQIYDQIPHIPGMPARQALNYFLANPQGYQAEWAKQYEATDLQKNAAAAGDPSLIGATLRNQATTKLTRGEIIGPDGKVTFAPPPAPAGYNYQQGANGQPTLAPIPGGLDAVTASSQAAGMGAAATQPAIAYGSDSMPIATNRAAMLGGSAPAAPQGGVPLGIRSNNPGNLQPGGHEATYGSPAEGILRASSNLDAYANQGINTVSGIVSKWAPAAGGNNTSAYVADVSKRLGVDPNQPLNMKDPRVKGAVLDAIFTHENGAVNGSPAPAQRSMLPELPAGQATYMQGQAKDASDRHDATVAAASESPMRINVLDNVINLSKAGVATGPGQEWQNSVLGTVANLPGLSRVMGGAKDNVSKFQELQKFTYQNAIRSWQAAGGTGTDAQMESMAHANPNDHLFPQALQGIAQWGKAAELAVQAKANAQDRFLATNGQTPTNQIKFENTWRNAMDPRVFQYSIMSPPEKQAFAAQQLKTPQAARAFIAKQQQLQALGALQ